VFHGAVVGHCEIIKKELGGVKRREKLDK